MKSPVLALPKFAFRTTRRLAKLPLPVLAGAAALIYRKVHRSAPTADVSTMSAFPKTGGGQGSRAGQAPDRPTSRAETTGPREPEVVVEPVPLAEPAMDLDAEVTLPSDLPIRSYDAMNAADASRAIRELTEVSDVRTVLTFEEENSKRSTVLTAARAHLAVLERAVRN